MADNLGTVTFPFQRLEETLSKLTVPELQQRLKKRGLKRSGLKAKLIQRLKEAIEIENEQDEENEELEAEKIPDADVSTQSIENDASMVKEDAHLPPPEASEEWNDASEMRYSSQQEEEHHQEEKSYLEEQTTVEQPVADNIMYGGFAEDAKEPELPEYDDSNVMLQQKEGVMEPEVPEEEEEEAHVQEEETYSEADEANAKTDEANINTDETCAEIGETYAKTDEIYAETDEIYAKGDEAYAETGETYAKIDETYAETGETYAKTDESNVETGETYATEEEAHSEESSRNLIETAAAEPNAYQEDRRKEEVLFLGDHGEDEENHMESETGERDESEIQKKKDSEETDQQMDTNMTDHREEKDGTIEIKVSHDDKVDIEDTEEQTEKEVKRPEKKHTTPVQIKKRKLTTDSDQIDSKTENAADKPKKRKWGSSASRESLTISSDSLKALIPDVPILPPSTDDPLGLGLDYGEMEEGEIDDSYGNEQAETETENKGEEDSEIMTEGSFKKEVRKGRIVRINTKDTVKIKTSEVKEEVEEIAEKENDESTNIEMSIDQKVSLLPEISTEESHEEHERSPSPAKHSPSQILSIFNLVRPFTLRQLRELLSKTGSVVEEGFWINKIKSHCYVTYETAEEAIASRNALHGTKWPSGNPKFLSVDFAVNDAMYRETEGKLGTAPSSPPAPKPEEKEKHRRDDDEREEEKRGRERQRKERERHRQYEKENKEEEHSKQKEKKEAPAKLLDDLFRKTKATPCIYWLPLTKEQITAKEKERELRRERQRNDRQKEIDADKAQQENRRKQQRETEIQRQGERSRERPNPPPSYRSRRDSKSPPKVINRSPELPRRGIRSLPAQYRRRSPSSSSSS